MANIMDDGFKERKSLEDIFMEYRPYHLREVLISLNVNNEQDDDDKDNLDDELITIDLKNKKVEKGIDSAIEDNA